MSEFTCAGRALIDGRIIWPESGGWKATSLEVDGDTAISGAVQLELAGGVTLSGTVVSGGVSDTRVLANILPGKGLLSRVTVPGQHFVEPTPRSIIENILSHTADDPTGQMQEQLNPTLPPICDQPLARWMRIQTTADDALNQIVSFIGLDWWFDLDGRIVVGEIVYLPVTPSTLDVLPHDHPEQGRLVFGTDDETIQPRTTVVTEYGSYQCTEVRYVLSNGKWRGILYYDPTVQT
jgi:hypothetical protein